jgi:hypothetical protein
MLSSFDLLLLLAALSAAASGSNRRFGTFLLGRGALRALLVEVFVLLLILSLRIPLTSLEDQDTDQDQSKNSVARSQYFETVFTAENLLRVVLGSRSQLRAIHATAHEPETLDDVGDVDGDTAHIQDQTSTIEEHVGLGRLVQLREHSGNANENDNVQDAGDQGRRGMEEAQVGFEIVIVRRRSGFARPEQRIVVREQREDDPEEEACCCECRGMSVMISGR